MHSKFASVLLAGVIALAALPSSVAAAQNTDAVNPRAISSSEGQLSVAVTYNGILSGVITSPHFWMQGGNIQIHGQFCGGWGVVADISGAHIANINSSGVGLGLVTATFGPRYTWTSAHRRYSLFGQGLVGEAFGFDSFFPNPQGVQTDARSLAVVAGGGLNYELHHHLALRAIEADYVRTQLPNSTTNVQNNVRFGVGIVFRFP